MDNVVGIEMNKLNITDNGNVKVVQSEGNRGKTMQQQGILIIPPTSIKLKSFCVDFVVPNILEDTKYLMVEFGKRSLQLKYTSDIKAGRNYRINFDPEVPWKERFKKGQCVKLVSSESEDCEVVVTGLNQDGTYAVSNKNSILLDQVTSKDLKEKFSCTLFCTKGIKVKCGKNRHCRFMIEHALALVFLVLLAAVVGTSVALRFSFDWGNVKDYYIAVEEIEWDYAPRNRDTSFCSKGSSTPEFHNYDLKHWINIHNMSKMIGAKYQKAKYVEYTDDTFTIKKESSADMGLLGPVIRANVGDVVRVHFRNHARHAYSLHPYAVGAGKASEGSGYKDHSIPTWRYDDMLAPFGLNTFTCKQLDFRTNCKQYKVHPGDTVMQDWPITEDVGPGELDGDTVAYFYSSDVGGRSNDGLESGLFGLLVVGKKGSAKPDFDEKFVVYTTINENKSPYLESNIYKYIIEPIVKAVPTGNVGYAGIDPALLLQALYKFGSKSSSFLSYSRASDLVEMSKNKQIHVGEVDGVQLPIIFSRIDTWFDPQYYDAHYGEGAAYEIVSTILYDVYVNTEDAVFQESNTMHTINGYLFCHQPDIEVTYKRKTRWYAGSLGNLDDGHTYHWHANTGRWRGKTVDTIIALPGNLEVYDMDAENIGKWLFHCHVNDHNEAGMVTRYNVVDPIIKLTNEEGVQAIVDTLTGVERVYYVSCQEVEWNYAPSGMNSCENGPYSESLKPYYEQSADTVGSTYTKLKYVAYESAQFKAVKDLGGEWDHLGLLGPTIRAEVGDNITVHFHNNCSKPVSMHPHGVFYGKGSEGASYADGTVDVAGDSVVPGDTYIYHWQVPESAGPSEKDSSSVAWAYHSHVKESNDTNAGLIGAIIITRKGEAKSSLDPSPKSVDREFVILVNLFDEGHSTLAIQNFEQRLSIRRGIMNVSETSQVWKNEVQNLQRQKVFQKYNKMPTINGFALCNLHGLVMNENELVRWYVFAMGSTSSLHSLVWDGHAAKSQGWGQGPSVDLLPGISTSSDMLMKAGNWILYDNVGKHYTVGARAHFNVLKVPDTVQSISVPGGREKVYYIAADEIVWDYLPSGNNQCSDQEISDNHMKQGHHRIGSTYVKARYREYMDENFQMLRFGTSSRHNIGSEHLGILGPIIRGQPGDTIKIHFRNKLRFAVNIHPNGPFGIDSASFKNNTVGPYETVTYEWTITSDAAPTPSDGVTSKVYTYGSSVDLISHRNAGLVGAIIVSQYGVSNSFDRPLDIHREFVLLMNNFDENKSPYLHLNTLKYAEAGHSVNYKDASFKESNRMYSINGYSYCNGKGYRVMANSIVRWYIINYGSYHDMQAYAWSGHSVKDQGYSKASVGINPGSTKTVDMTASNGGMWMHGSAVIHGQEKGMQATFTVEVPIHEMPRKVGNGFYQYNQKDNKPTLMSIG